MALIAVKREVATIFGRFIPWSEGHVTKLATSHCTIDSTVEVDFRAEYIGHARSSVQSPLVVLIF